MMQYPKALSDPPLKERYGAFLSNSSNLQCSKVMEECELPLIDISTLRMMDDGEERQSCASAIARAATEWGFFMVINHGISSELLEEMRKEQHRLFIKPFEEKSSKILKGTYSWGNPMATSLTQLPWSENFLVPLKMIIEDQEWCSLEFSSLRETMKKLGSAMTDLAHLLARVLAENLGFPGNFISEKCSMSTNYFRLNHYPPCPHLQGTFGLVPHTDSDFLTILSQDQVGGLQLRKDSSWYTVKPNQDALIVNIGDLFQAWSNDFYKSVEHKVMSNAEADRYSVAYFLCPSMDSIIVNLPSTSSSLFLTSRNKWRRTKKEQEIKWVFQCSAYSLHLKQPVADWKKSEKLADIDKNKVGLPVLTVVSIVPREIVLKKSVSASWIK